VKIGPVDTEIALLILKKRKKRRKYIALPATLPSGLSNFVNFNPINLEFGGIIRTYERYLPCKFWKNPSRRT